MRLILKTKKAYIAVFRINSSNRLITGWYAGNMLRNEIGILPDRHFDPHFSYPEDGDFHLSFKSMNPGDEEYITIYWDRVRIKKIYKGERTDEWMTREEFMNHPRWLLGHSMIGYRAKPIEKFQSLALPTLAFNVFSGEFNSVKMESIVLVHEIGIDDYLVDISNLDKYTVNVTAYLRNKSEKSFNFSSLLDHWQQNVETFILTDNIVLDLVCIYGPHDSQ